MNELKFKSCVQDIADVLEECTDEERKEIMDEIKGRYCSGCGLKLQPGTYEGPGQCCRCWNDE